MARPDRDPGIWLLTDLDDAPVLVLAVDAEDGPGERALRDLGSSAYEGDGAFYLLPQDAWAERTLDGATLTVRIRTLDDVLLRRSTTVDPEVWATAAGGTLVVNAPAGADAAAVAASLLAGEDPPLVLAPEPPA